MRYLLVIPLICACAGSSPPAPTHSPAPVAAQPEGLVEIGPDLAPVPFPPGTLARTFRDGASITFRIEAAGQEPVLLTTEFVDPTEDGVTLRDTTTALDGTPRGAPATATATWTELESHAHFPRQATSIADSVVEVPAGRFDSFEYRITATKQGSTTVTTAWFAKELPGPPVKLTREVDGRLAMTMVLVRTHRPGAAQGASK